MTDKPVPFTRKVYLAANVYAEYDGDQITLTTSDGSDIIQLNKEALLELLQFIDGVIDESLALRSASITEPYT